MERIGTFQLCFWRRLLRVPWTARRSNQSILKEISPEYSLEELMPKLKLQYFGHLMQRADSLGKTLMFGKIEQRRRRGWERMNWLDGITDSADLSLSKLWGIGKDGTPGLLESLGSQRVRHDLGTKQQQDWKKSWRYVTCPRSQSWFQEEQPPASCYQGCWHWPYHCPITHSWENSTGFNTNLTLTGWLQNLTRRCLALR